VGIVAGYTRNFSIGLKEALALFQSVYVAGHDKRFFGVCVPWQIDIHYVFEHHAGPKVEE
jgi:hypothetical protein